MCMSDCKTRGELLTPSHAHAVMTQMTTCSHDSDDLSKMLLRQLLRLPHKQHATGQLPPPSERCTLPQGATLTLSGS
jgi:hypothetical protein